MSRAGVATTVPPKREQSFGGGDLLSLICPELGVTPHIDPGTDLEDELSIPASPPAADEHGAVPLSVPADVDSELEQVFGDVGSLPTMVTPICDLDGGLCVNPAECPVIEPPGVSVVVTRPSMVYSPAGVYHRWPSQYPRRRSACYSTLLIRTRLSRSWGTRSWGTRRVVCFLLFP